MSLTETYMAIIGLISIAVLNIFSKVLVNGKLTITPTDRELMVGQSTYFNCSTSMYDMNVHWYFYPVGGTGLDVKYVYAFGKLYNPFADRFQVDRHSDGVCNLVIMSATLQDAGRYDCQEDGGLGEMRSAQLIVLDENPNCESSAPTNELIGSNSCNIEPEELRLTCRVKFHGNIPPVMEWKSSEENKSVAHRVTSESGGKSVTYHLITKADLITNGSFYLCQTTRTTINARSTCTSDLIRILYAFSNNLTVNGTMDNEIVCIANTSQICEYKWRWFKGDDVTTESNNATLIPKKPGWHKCEATCDIKTHPCIIMVMTAFVSVQDDARKSAAKTKSPSDTYLDTTLVVVIILVIIVFLVVVFFVALYVKKLKRKYSEELETITQSQISGVRGIEIFKGEIYISRKSSSTIEVYDAKSCEFMRSWNVNGLENAIDLLGKEDSRYNKQNMFILDSKSTSQNSVIFRMDISGRATFANKWETDFEERCSLSASVDSNVILCNMKMSTMTEYSPEGTALRKIHIAGSLRLHVWNCFKLSDDRYVVSTVHDDDTRPTVLLFELKEQVNDVFEIEEDQIKEIEISNEKVVAPAYLSVDKGGLIYVPDTKKDRLLIFNSELQRQKEVENVTQPRCVWLDESYDCMFIVSSDGINIHQLSSGNHLKHFIWSQFKSQGDRLRKLSRFTSYQKYA